MLECFYLTYRSLSTATRTRSSFTLFSVVHVFTVSSATKRRLLQFAVVLVVVCTFIQTYGMIIINVMKLCASVVVYRSVGIWVS